MFNDWDKEDDNFEALTSEDIETIADILEARDPEYYERRLAILTNSNPYA